MGVTTTADERLQDARDSLQEAHTSLGEFLKEDCWGRDDYDNDFIKLIHKVQLKIYKLKQKV